MNESIFAIITAALYLASGLVIGVRLFSDANDKRPPRNIGIGLGFAALALHAYLLYLDVLVSNGVNLSFYNALSLIAWTIAGLLLSSSLSKPVENLGIVLLPFAAISILTERQFEGVQLLGIDASLALKAHVLSSLLAYSLLTLATVQALLLAYQNNHLRHHHPGGIIRALPPLQTMESLLFEMISLGFILLSLGLATGFIYLDNMFAQQVAHKTILSIIAWVTFGILLWGRYHFGWRGKTAVRWTLSGFALLMLAYFGSKFVIELILQR